MKRHSFGFYKPGEAPKENPGCYVVHIPAGIKDKQELFLAIAEGLRFPAYFGFNWDAFDECLSDLSWLDKPMVNIWHEDIPMISDRLEIRRYLSILDDTIRAPGAVTVMASFPEAVRGLIRRILT